MAFGYGLIIGLAFICVGIWTAAQSILASDEKIAGTHGPSNRLGRLIGTVARVFTFFLPQRIRDRANWALVGGLQALVGLLIAFHAVGLV